MSDRAAPERPEIIRCGWCGKGQSEVKQIIVTAGISWVDPPIPNAAICNECVEISVEIIAGYNTEWRDRLIAKLDKMGGPDEPKSN